MINKINMEMRSKIIHLVRHGQATHNVRAEPAKAAGCSFEDFIKLMKEDDEIDAQLTPNGIQQAKEVSKTVSELNPQLIAVSPLSRAIDTGYIVFGKRESCLPHYQKLVDHDQCLELGCTIPS